MEPEESEKDILPVHLCVEVCVCVGVFAVGIVCP